MTIGIQANGNDLDNLFDRWVFGSAAAATGIQSNGTDVSSIYQALAAGNSSQGANCGLHSNGTDLAAIFAAKGTTVTNTPLPINGKLYNGGLLVSTGSGTIGYSVSVYGGYCTVSLSRSGGTGSPAAGQQDRVALPSGATSCRLTLTYQSGTTCTTTNNAATAIAISTGASASITSPSILSNNPGSQTQYNVMIELLNAGGSVISTSNITWAPSWSGSV